jgi:tetratricopeptide (TPR) repeat protein
MSGQEKHYQQAMNQGHSAAWEQDWGQAASYYRQALDDKKDDPQALINLALALFKMGEYQKSLQYYLLATKVAPNDPVPL